MDPAPRVHPMTVTEPSITKIERIHAPSRRQFTKEFVEQRKPVIITGVADQWRAFRDWTPDRLKRVAGDAEVAVHYNARGSFHDWYTNPTAREDRRMKLADVIDIMRGPRERAHHYYMTEHLLAEISAELCNDLSVGSLIDERPVRGVCTGPTFFFGCDTSMPAHYHSTTEAFMCQLQGTKQVILHAPEQTPNLYPLPWYAPGYNFSQVDWFRDHIWKNVDYERFPLVKRAEALEFTVHPGEILFIPIHWWHVTNVDGYQLSITYFFKSDRSRWCYPHPGREVENHEAYRSFRERRAAEGKPVPEGRAGLTLYERMHL